MVSQIERNRVSPAIDTLLSLAAALDIDLEYLFSDYKRERSARIVRVGERTTFRDPVLSMSARPARRAPAGHRWHRSLPDRYGNRIEDGSEEYGHKVSNWASSWKVAPSSPWANNHTSWNGATRPDSLGFSSYSRECGDTTLRVFWVITPPRTNFPRGVDYVKTLAEKIFDANLVDMPFAEAWVLNLDVVFCHEITTPIAIDDLVAKGMDRVFDASKIKAVIDHVSPARIPRRRAGQNPALLVRRQGIKDFFDIGSNGSATPSFPKRVS